MTIQCSRCSGKGEIPARMHSALEGSGFVIMRTCPKCSGRVEVPSADADSGGGASRSRLRRMGVWAALLATAVFAHAASAMAESLHEAVKEGDIAAITRMLDEPPRVSRRLQSLSPREAGANETIYEILPGGAGAGREAGPGPLGRT